MNLNKELHYDNLKEITNKWTNLEMNFNDIINKVTELRDNLTKNVHIFKNCLDNIFIKFNDETSNLEKINLVKEYYEVKDIININIYEFNLKNFDFDFNIKKDKNNFNKLNNIRLDYNLNLNNEFKLNSNLKINNEVRTSLKSLKFKNKKISKNQYINEDLYLKTKTVFNKYYLKNNNPYISNYTKDRLLKNSNSDTNLYKFKNFKNNFIGKSILNCDTLKKKYKIF